MFLRLLPVREMPSVGVVPQCILGGENKIIAIRGDEVADYFFGLTELVAVCRIDEVAAGFNVAVKDFFCFASLGAVTPACAEVAGA
jgi:hypothetical protein